MQNYFTYQTPADGHAKPVRPKVLQGLRKAIAHTLLLSSLLTAANAHAQQKLWTLQALTDYAMQHNPAVKAARLELEASQALVRQANSRPNPELAYSQEDTRAQNRTQTLQLTLPLETGGKRAARIHLAELGLQMARTALALQQAELRSAVAAAYADCLIAQARVELASDSRQLAGLATDAVSKRVAAGKVSPLEISKARLAESTFKVELLQAENQHRHSQLLLQSLLGIDTEALALQDSAQDSLPELPSAEQLRALLQQAPAIVRARQEIEQAAAELSLEKSKRLPDLAVSFGVKRSPELSRDQWVFGVSLPLPLFDRNSGNVLAALKRQDKAREELNALTQRHTRELLQAGEKLGSTRAEIELLTQQAIPDARAAYQAARLGFEHGKFSFLEVLDAQRSYFSVRSQYLQALALAYATAAEIERISGAGNPAQTADGE